jgi:hypothetical protein
MSGEARRPARRVAIAGSLLLCLGHAGCRCGGDDGPAVRDAGGRGDGGPGVDAGVADAAGGDGSAGPDAAPADAGGASATCPAWRRSPPTGRAWLYVEAVSNGVPLTSEANRVDVYVRRAGDRPPGERADANDPCAVASYDPAAIHVSVLVAAVGFSSQEREFRPQDCLEAAPCSVELPPSLDTRYYRIASNRIDLGVASDAPEAARVEFAAAVANDALVRSKALHRKLADELNNAEKATHVPALDLAIHYTESKLHKTCDARCIDAPALDPEIRSYLNAARDPRHRDPFERRTAPDRWHIKDR